VCYRVFSCAAEVLLGMYAAQEEMCCSVVQCGAVCCSVLQCVAVRCSVFPCAAEALLGVYAA